MATFPMMIWEIRSLEPVAYPFELLRSDGGSALPDIAIGAIRTKRNEIVGRWASDLLGFSDEMTTAQVNALVHAGFAGGDVAVVDRILAAFTAAGLRADRRSVERLMCDLLAVARQQLAGMSDRPSDQVVAAIDRRH